MSKSRKLARICADLLLFILVCAAELALHRWAQPVHRGFFCNDDSLRYPYRANTFSVQLLVIIALAVPITLIICIELCRCNNHHPAHQAQQSVVGGLETIFGSLSAPTTPTSLNSHPQNSNTTKKKHNDSQQHHYGHNPSAHLHHTTPPPQQSNGYRLLYRLRQCYKYIGYYLFGLALTVLATELGKYSIGRLRPHFFAACQPELPDGSTCADPKNHATYIEDYHCASPNLTATQLHEINLSFPSGHASVIFYAMFYITLYVQCMCSTLATKLFKHVLQFIAMMFAWYVALTRITDYMHHWSDVLVGIALGTLIAALIGRYIAEFYGVRSSSFGGNCQRRLPKRYLHGGQQHQPQIRPSSSASPKTATPATATIPAYTFGSLQQQQHILQHLAQQQLHLQHQQQQQAAAAAAQSLYSNASAYANYGYVP